jgi:hypothetical protein
MPLHVLFLKIQQSERNVFSLKRPHTIRKMNYNIGMNSTITETMSARSQLTKPKNVGSEG